MQTNRGKKTIGLLVSGIMDDFTVSVCHGAVEQAKNLGMQAVVFPGKYINRDLSGNPELMFEYQFNTIFSFAQKENVDALLCTIGSIGSFTTMEEMKKMLAQYEGIPLVLLGTKIDGYTSVTFDNATGIREGLKYLIDHKQCKNIGIVSGNRDNTDVVERETAFLNYLKERGLPFQESMLVRGDCSRRCKEAFQKLLDENSNLDAVFCINDDTAMGLYAELRARGIKPGSDLYVMGYDDTVVAAKAYPSLSTIHADGAVLGREAIEMLSDMLQGKAMESRVIPTQFIKRESFGSSIEHEKKMEGMEIPDISFEDIFYRTNGSSKSHDAILRLRNEFQKLEDALDAVYSGSGGETEQSALKNCMNQFLNDQDVVKLADTNRLLVFFEQMYQILLGRQSSDAERFLLRDTFAEIYSRLYCAMDYEIGSIRAQEEMTNYSLKLFIRDMLQFEKGNDQSYASLLENLSWLQIENAGIYLFEEPLLHLSGEVFQAPERVMLKAFLEDGKVYSIPSIHQSMTVSNLFEHISRRETADNAYVLFPLYYNATLYGLFLCDLTEALYVNGEFLVNQVSSATRMIQLLHSNEMIQEKLEESLAVLKENNLVLDSLSKSDALTELLNRRGFYEEAEDFWKKKEAEGYSAFVFYIDMNNLKLINDRFGHSEGDFSLKRISRLLAEAVAGHGIAGRIGGDEFACIIVKDAAYPNSSDFVEQLYQSFDSFNQNSEKAYNVTVSAGACSLAKGGSLTLQQALSLADEKLYEEKKRRKTFLMDTLQKK